MDDIEALLTDTHSLVRDTIREATSAGLPPAAIGKAVADALAGKSRVVPATALPGAAADPPPAAAPFDLPAIITAIMSAAKAEPVNVHVINGEVKQVRTVIDRDAETGRVIGSHEEYVSAAS